MAVRVFAPAKFAFLDSSGAIERIIVFSEATMMHSLSVAYARYCVGDFPENSLKTRLNCESD
jgi:hypothetical protein